MRDAIKIPGVAAGQDEIGVYIHNVAPRYFETMGIPLASGRELAASDREKSPRSESCTKPSTIRGSGRTPDVRRRGVAALCETRTA